MKIVLMYPRYRRRMWNGVAEPLGICYIASALRDIGYDPLFVDLTFVKDLSEIDEMIKDADIIGISSSSILFGRTKEVVVPYLRSKNPKATYLIGGPHATFWPEDALDGGFDYAFQGESEKTIKEFMEAHKKGDPTKVRGISYKRNGRFIMNPRMSFTMNLDEITFPARDLYDYDSYVESGLADYGIVGSRGCPYNCVFCKPAQDKLFGQLRMRGPGNVAQEIESLVKLRGQNIRLFFKDDTITLQGPEWFRELKRELDARNVNICWMCQTRVDTVDYETVAAMKEAGCVDIYFGVESGSQRILDFYRKEITPEQTIKAFDICHSLGINPIAYMMLGHPHETHEDIKLTYKLMRRIRPARVNMYFCTALPGKHIYDWAKSEGILKKHLSYEEFDTARNRDTANINMELKYLSREDLIRWKKKIYRSWLIQSSLSPKNFKANLWLLGKLLRNPRQRFFQLKSKLFTGAVGEGSTN